MSRRIAFGRCMEDFDLDAAGPAGRRRRMSRPIVEVLARKLEDALPAETEVRRGAKGLLSREKVVEAIEVTLGEYRYGLRRERRGVEATRAKEVRGVVIKREPLELDARGCDGLTARAARAGRGQLGGPRGLGAAGAADGVPRPAPRRRRRRQPRGARRTSRAWPPGASRSRPSSGSASSRAAAPRSPPGSRSPTSRSPGSTACARSARSWAARSTRSAGRTSRGAPAGAPTAR